MASVIIFLGVILWNGYLTLIYDSPLIVTVLLLEIVLFFMGIFWSVHLRKNLTVECRMGIPVAQTGKPAAGELVITNKSSLPLMHTTVKLAYTNIFTGRRQTIRKGVWVPAHGESRVDFEVSSEQCGVIKLALTKFMVPDALGFIRFRKKCRITADIVVLPELIEMDMELAPELFGGMGDGSEYDKDRPGDDVSEVFLIRDYREGDRMQDVHWKATAKRDSLMVKEYARPLVCTLLILANLRNQKESAWKHADQYITLLLSYSAMLIKKGCHHYVAWYDQKSGEIVRQAVHCDEDVYVLMNEIMRSMPYTEEQNLELLYQSEFPYEAGLKTYQFSMDLKMREGGMVLWDGRELLNA